MAKLIGDKPNQVPVNADLGDLAYQNSQNVVIDTISNEFGVGHIRCVQVTIADDSVAEVIPPRTGGFCFVTSNGNIEFPRGSDSDLAFYDVGSSLSLALNGFGTVGNEVVGATGIYTGTTGTDGKLTISADTGRLLIENRRGGERTIQLTFV